MIQESEYQVRPIPFFLIIQKSLKNGTKNSLKKLIFATLRPTHFESFFRKFEVIAFLFTKLSTDSKKIVYFSTTPSESFTLPILLLIFSWEAGCEYKLFSSFDLTRPVIEPKSLYQQQTLYPFDYW